MKKNNILDTRKIETSLINKEEVFKMLALAEATSLPLLLVGPPGTGKTKTVIEYSKAWLQKSNNTVTNQDFIDKLYILETDEGTKNSEVKGMPDLQKLFTENKYEILAPISTAEIIVINEVDKASSNIRNSFLGVMNEKFLFNGKHKMPCKWKLFVATCNEIPKDEIDNPFWDRFMLKMNVSRITANEISKYYSKGDKNYKEYVNIAVPSKAEINSVQLSESKLEKFLSIAYTNLSDRTLTFVPFLTKAISLIWNISVDKALIKLVSIMINTQASSKLKDLLYNQEVKNVLNRIEVLNTYSDESSLSQGLTEIENLVSLYASQNRITQEDVEEIEQVLAYTLEEHKVKIQENLQKEDKALEVIDADAF